MRGGGQAMVGAFVLAGLALGLAAVVMFGHFSPFNPSVQAAVVFQDSIAGLSVGAPVTFRGVRVGAVDSIAIDFDPKTRVAYIPVVVTLKPDRAPGARRGDADIANLPELLARGLRAELKVQSFVTGQSQIDLDFDPASQAVLHPDITSLPEIPVRQSTLQRAAEELSQLPLRELADNTVATLKSLRGLAEKLDQDLPPLVDSLKASSDRSGAVVDSANQAIKALQTRLDATLDAIRQVAATGDQQLKERGADLHSVMAATEQTMRQVRETVVDLKGLTSDRGATRVNLEATLRDLAAAAASLRGFASDVERNPQLLLTGRKP
jgi:paraquat-inducible protein B